METGELAVIRGVNAGIRDIDRPVLWFAVHSLSGGALIVYEWDEAGEFLRENGITNLKNLDGQVCVISIQDGNISVKSLFTS